MDRSQVDYGAGALGLGHSRKLAAFLSQARFEDLPAAVTHAARRGVLDWMGCALAGSTHPSVAILLRTLGGLRAAGPAAVLGYAERLGAVEAALANGQMGHVLDFDDTHMGGVILHASSPVLSALFSLSSLRRLGGRDLVLAYALGFEAGVRVGQAAPDHHAGGWHLTGTLGTLAAGASAGRALGLDPRAMGNALALSATQAAGMQQNRGTMAKSFHAGRAASNGLLAALLAENGYDGSDEILEGKRGFCRIYSGKTREEALLDGLGERWEILANGHKPYACGVVLHPAIDAMIALRAKVERPQDVRVVRLRVNPAAVTITGVANPETGLKSKFSLTHSAAVSFLDRAAGVTQFSGERAAAGDISAFASRIEVETDEALGRDQAEVVAGLTDGGEVRQRVEHASGTVANPMSDEALLAKFRANAEPVLGIPDTERLAEAILSLDRLDDVSQLAAIAQGRGAEAAATR